MKVKWKKQFEPWLTAYAFKLNKELTEKLHEKSGQKIKVFERIDVVKEGGVVFAILKQNENLQWMAILIEAMSKGVIRNPLKPAIFLEHPIYRTPKEAYEKGWVTERDIKQAKQVALDFKEIIAEHPRYRLHMVANDTGVFFYKHHWGVTKHDSES